jgi:putative ABC transport system permease protein
MVDHGVAPRWFTIGLNPVALVIAFGLGVGTAVTGAAVVALRASRIQPVEALREAAVSRRAMTPLRVLLGVGMLAAAVIGGVVIARSMPQEAVNPRKYAMVPVLYAGAFALLSPLLLRPVTWLATVLPRRAAGPLLVRANLLNSRRRSAATVAPVVIAAGLTAALLCVQAAGADATVNQAREQIHAGYVVVPDDGGQLSAGAVAALLAMQRTVPGLRETSHRSFGINIGDLDGQVIDQLDAQGVPPAAMGTVFTPKVLQGSLDHLGNNSIVVDQDTLTGDDLALGQRILVWLPDGARREVRIAAVVQTAVYAMQFQRIAGQSRLGHAVFEDEPSARKWLRESSVATK